MTAPLILDIETVPTDAHVMACMAEKYPVADRAAPSNWKDPEKIEGWFKADEAKWNAEREQRIADGALDPRSGRVLCLGLGGLNEKESRLMFDRSMTVQGNEASMTARLEDQEAIVLRQFWHCADLWGGRIATFNGTFDLRFLALRSLIVGIEPTVPAKTIRDWFRRYTTWPHFDCRAMLTNWDTYGAGTLGDWCKAFGIPHDDAVTGADIYPLFVAKNFDAIDNHCRADAKATASLYARIAPFFND